MKYGRKKSFNGDARKIIEAGLLLVQGKSLTEIGKIMNISRQRVHQILSIVSDLPAREAKPFEKGSGHWNWKGGITPINMKIRGSREYRIWRRAVMERDRSTCVWCGQKEGRLDVDHIKPFSLYPELRFAIDNGRTLCLECHRKTDTWGGKMQKIKRY